MLLALLSGVSLAAAQSAQRPDKPEHSTKEPTTDSAQRAPDSGVFVNGRLAVPGAPDGDTVPSKFSEKNAADDQRPIAGYTFKHLTDAQRHAIYQSVTGQSQAAAVTKVDLRVGDQLPSTAALAPLPDELSAQIPGVTRYRFAKAGDNLLLINPGNRVVVGIIRPMPN
jgi:hypothetical protein